jgi:ATP-dependent helicase Lhr and Lhr-like helicase
VNDLHPLLQHHIVNTLGWPSLRPLQKQAVEPLTAGQHALVIAPTAGGKTEAAAFPALSRMLHEDWRGLSVLYLCPLRALLNNLLPRLQGYADLLGRRAALWHGDVAESQRERIRSEPPDLLLTTPESVEAMLISSKTDHAWLFRNLQVVIIDEIHAFAGDDRGWHLLSVVQRLQRLAGREPQRIGLSATVGDPAALLEWVCAGTSGERSLLVPPPQARPKPDVTLDHVGSIANAAIVLSRMHRGEKRLVFVDSRARAEELVRELRGHGTNTWLSHGSLGRDERAAAEEAFATAPEGVIVATSTMELGIDVGDLDRVAQIDAPWSVAGFLQRLGRTGRRAGAVSNCLFLSTTDRSLRDTLGLLTAWGEGYVEPVLPPPMPVHVLAQQLLALLRQEGSLGRHTWTGWLGDPLVLGDDVQRHLKPLVAHLLAIDVLTTDGDMLQLGPEAERRYGKRHYLDLTAVFADPPTLSVTYGRTSLGQIHLRSLLRRRDDEPAVVLIAGRDWDIEQVDWRRRIVHVQPAKHQRGRAQWVGTGPGITRALAQAARRALAGADPPGVELSQRAHAATNELRSQFRWLSTDESTAVVRDPDGVQWWWTFAGTAANTELAATLGALAPTAATNGLALRLADGAHHSEVVERIRGAAGEIPPPPPAELGDAYKFADVLPSDVAETMFLARDRDLPAVEATAALPVHRVRLDERGPRP